MNLRSLKDDILLEKIKILVKNERETTLQVLQHLREVERRHLFASLAYSSLFEYAVKELKYSESSAQRRISSMRLLKELPELERKVESGALPLSTLSQAQSFFRQEKTQASEKMQILCALEFKSAREVEKELMSRASEPEKLIKEKLRPVSATHTEIKFVAEEDFVNEIAELRALLSHKIPNASLKEVLSYTLKETLNRLRYKEPKIKKIIQQSSSRQSIVHESGERKNIEQHSIGRQKATPPASALKSFQKNSRNIPTDVKRQVWARDRGQCSFKCMDKRCAAKHYLEFDHIKPFAMGGLPTVENLRLRCRTHNQLEALKSFGTKKISQFIPRML